LHKCLNNNKVYPVAEAGGLMLEWRVSHVGSSAGVDIELNHQHPARPPIPRDILWYEPRGNAPLWESTMASILEVMTQMKSSPTLPTLPTRPKRTQTEPLESM
jgi:hypothetical protein